MNPWLWLWAPHLEFPLSGNVVQDIDPVANLFSKSNAKHSVKSKIEQKSFDFSSYGQQLGLITEVLLDLVEKTSPEECKDSDSITRLKNIQIGIEKIKSSEYKAEINGIEKRIDEILVKKNLESQQLLEMIERVMSRHRT